ncbi:D-alanyl-D-alanine carboxypeptidase (penicillin-binding protein 5/6) [Caldicoprobacter guelmensis]|uniref:D-alanyl-D-alanine carboxypeptidase family protein n=1 Tax=Caldicoprobacter guelmensis TaxID=1170224 RepID=UPI001959DA80|nr:D-alanyl-D-alanine carboxypeptidase family protein [Caldicoprobacter guelmensis]MBM7581316.1 D-alanyl-D-alanine carboxypeptidase (penicillin-binding protein 5/6) [Caldicoprobacter guelmensis]
MSTSRSVVLCWLLTAVFAFMPFGVAAAQPVAELPFAIQSKAALLMDYETGTVLYEKNAHETLPMASITKIMTLLLAMEAIEDGRLKLDDPVHVSEYAASMGGSTVFLAPGETFPVSTILESVIVASANDGSVALAEKIYGSHELFVQKMNERAQQLGMKNTHFVNCTGLPAQNHYTTAYDVALMSRELLKHPLFFKWSTIWLDYMRDGKTMLVNTNKLVRFYQGCDGIKTGYTEQAGHCISATAKRGNLRLIAVILGAPTSQIRFSEASKLLDFGFANYESVLVIKKGQIVHNEIPVTGGRVSRIMGLAADNLSMLVSKGASKEFTKEVQISSPLRAPIKQGQKVGVLVVKQDGQEIGRVDVVASDSVEVAGVFDYFRKIFNNWLKRQADGEK